MPILGIYNDKTVTQQNHRSTSSFKTKKNTFSILRRHSIEPIAYSRVITFTSDFGKMLQKQKGF